jgi:DNA-binding transcriptional LysR family regulator
VAFDGRPKHPLDLVSHRCLQFLDPHTERPFTWHFINAEESIPVETRGPLTFTDPKLMLTQCVAGTGIAQAIGWDIGKLLKRGDPIDLVPKWPGERFPLLAFHPSGKHPPAKICVFTVFCLEIAKTLQRQSIP